MSTNPFNCSIKRRTLLKAGLTLGALTFASPAVSQAAAARKAAVAWNCGQYEPHRLRSNRTIATDEVCR
jgi:hypothetical protein